MPGRKSARPDPSLVVSRHDLRVLVTPLLHLPVVAPGAGHVPFKVTRKTSPGADLIELWCMSGKGVSDAAAAKPAEIVRRPSRPASAQRARGLAALRRVVISPRYGGAGGDHERLPLSVLGFLGFTANMRRTA